MFGFFFTAFMFKLPAALKGENAKQDEGDSLPTLLSLHRKLIEELTAGFRGGVRRKCSINRSYQWNR